MAIDEARLEQVFGQVVTDFAGALTVRMVRLGDRLGFYRAMTGAGPMTPAEIARKTGTDERYVREWCSQQFVSGYLEHDPDAGSFMLTDEIAAIVAQDDSPVFLAGMSQLLATLYFDEDRLDDAFRTGKGVGWHEHNAELYGGTQRLFRPGYLAHLVQEWIPALDGVQAKLESGASVADVGCGYGASTIILAKAYPNSTFVGVDYHADSIEQARKAAADAGVADRVRFEIGNAGDYAGDGYDLIALFDCLHDMGDPVGALKHMYSSLKPDGTVLLVEPMAGDRLEDNVNPIGRIFYGFSSLICTPGSKAQDVGLALGAQAGEQRLREVAEQAGFRQFRRATETPVNLILELRR